MAVSRIGTTRDGSLILPDNAVSQGFGILARRRSGKSNLAGVMEETFCQRGDPWVCLDPVSAHWGIRYLDDGGHPGKPSGYDVMIVGGKYGDVPFDDHSGGSLAQIIVDTDISCVIDLGNESMNAMHRFAADFANELRRINETPRHVLIEEAHTFVPQQLIYDNQKVVRGAVTKLGTMGGGKGIGYTMISQRPASVAKDMLEQIDNLFVLRMSGPRDLKAVEDWFEHNVGDKVAMKTILTSLPSFAPGEAWVCAPDWVGVERAKIRERKTYHAGRTPKRGEKVVAPKRIELGKVIEQFRKAATKRQIAVREEVDLKKELAETKRKLALSEKAQPIAKACDHPERITLLEATVDAAVLQRDAWEEAFNTKSDQLGDAQRRLLALQKLGEDVQTAANYLSGPEVMKPTSIRFPKAATVRAPARAENGRGRTSAAAIERARIIRRVPLAQVRENGHTKDLDLSSSQRKILTAIAAFEPLGLTEVARPVAAAHARVKHTTGSFGNNVSKLFIAGMIEKPSPGTLTLTEAGRAIAESPDVPASLDGLHAAWRSLLSSSQAAILDQIIEAYPGDISREQIAENIGVKANTGSFGNNLSKLRVLGILENTASGFVRATELLFPGGLM